LFNDEFRELNEHWDRDEEVIEIEEEIEEKLELDGEEEDEEDVRDGEVERIERVDDE